MFKKTPPSMTTVILMSICLAQCRQIKAINHWSNDEKNIIRRGISVLC